MLGLLVAAGCVGVSDLELEQAQETAVADAVATALTALPTPTPHAVPTPQPTATPQPAAAPAPVPTPAPDFADVYADVFESVFQVETETDRSSAWLIDEGVLVTNQHAVGDNEAVLVRQALGPPFVAAVVTVDVERDLALLFFDERLTRARPLATGTLTTDDIARPLMALGHSEGLPRADGSVGAPRVKVGVLSQLIDLGDSGINLTMDAAIDPGESGGPVFNARGEVVGMNRGFRTVTPDGLPVLGTFFALHVNDINTWYQTIRVFLSQQPPPAPAP
jgi:putative serine protease PepD